MNTIWDELALMHVVLYITDYPVLLQHKIIKYKRRITNQCNLRRLIWLVCLEVVRAYHHKSYSWVSSHCPATTGGSSGLDMWCDWLPCSVHIHWHGARNKTDWSPSAWDICTVPCCDSKFMIWKILTSLVSPVKFKFIWMNYLDINI